MSALRIQLFGAMNVSHQGRAREARPIHGVQSLLAWLLVHRRKKMHAREELAAVFWGDQSDARARSCLNTALWRLRQVLEPEGIPRGTYLTSDSGAVGFNGASDYWLDVDAFEQGAASGSEEAVACYTGELLEGFYEDWVLRERERLRLLYLDCLGKLLRRHSDAGALERALECGRQILALDPLREDIHRELMRIHVRSGQRSLALQQYERCRAVLEAELGAPPMEETRALHASLISADGQPRTVAHPRAPHSAMVPASGPRPELALALRSAAVKLEEARVAITEALRLAGGNPQ